MGLVPNREVVTYKAYMFNINISINRLRNILPNCQQDFLNVKDPDIRPILGLYTATYRETRITAVCNSKWRGVVTSSRALAVGGEAQLAAAQCPNERSRSSSDPPVLVHQQAEKLKNYSCYSEQ